MRQVLSWRFVAAVLAVVAMALVVYIVGSRRGGSNVAGADDGDVRRMDFISLVASIRADGFAMTANDTVSGDLTLVMPNGQNVRVFPGTPGRGRVRQLHRRRTSAPCSASRSATRSCGSR